MKNNNIFFRTQVPLNLKSKIKLHRNINSIKKAGLLLLIIFNSFCFAQTWNTTGNTGTNPGTDFLGTTDNKDLIFKTNGIERQKISNNGKTLFQSNENTSDGFDIINSASNLSLGTDIVWIKSTYSQANDVGVLSLSTVNWQYPIFSARENGKIFMGIYAYNYATPNCSDCNSYRLFVKDGIRTEKIKVDVASANGWADYVFQKDYSLPTLDEVEEHIKENGHLPNIPSTLEVMKDGINLGEMDAKLLQKIEELTLYSIDQNKRIKKLEMENDALKSLKERVEKLEATNNRK